MHIPSNDLPYEALAEAFRQIPAERFERLWRALQDDLRGAADRMLERERKRGGVTFTRTKLWQNALLHFVADETFDRWLEERGLPRWKDAVERDLTPDECRTVVRLLARRMGEMLRDRAKERKAQKRGDGLTHETFGDYRHDIAAVESANPAAVAEADDLLGQLERRGLRREAEAARLRWECGMPVAEIAKVLEVSERTINRDLETVRKELETILEARSQDS